MAAGAPDPALLALVAPAVSAPAALGAPAALPVPAVPALGPVAVIPMVVALVAAEAEADAAPEVHMAGVTALDHLLQRERRQSPSSRAVRWRFRHRL